jgi:hypothetical protein
MVAVHKFKVWDVSHDHYIFPPYRCTEEGIKAKNGVIIDGTSTNVDEKHIDEQFLYKPDVENSDASRS